VRHGSLFSGIGGFDLASEWMGWENVFHCEWNEFGKKVLKYYWPNAISYHDINKTDFSIHRGQIDLLSGGFPCQPYSSAGKRLGKEDDRHLWPEMLRAIREIQPTWVVGENVLGLVNWNGGLVFHEVQADLEAEGYEVQPYVLPAVSVNAPHRRDRVWFVAYSNGSRINREKKYENSSEDCRNRQQSNNTYNNGKIWRTSSDTDCGRQSCQEYRKTESGQFTKEGISNYWRNFPTQSPVCAGNDGISSRLDGITFPKWRNESIKAGGNAIVPQVAIQIFKAIEQYECARPTQTTQTS